MERIVSASSNPDAVVLDPFCGCGTTIHAAENLGRRWIGIDVTYHAIEVIADRLKREFGSTVQYELGGIPKDAQSARRLAQRYKYQIQWWANYLVGVQQMREVKRGRDRGIDGEIFFPAGPGRGLGRILTSVKGGERLKISDLRDFRGVLEREKADGGIFICLDPPTRDMRSDAASAGFFTVGNDSYPRLQIVSVEEWFEGKTHLIPACIDRNRLTDSPLPRPPSRGLSPTADNKNDNKKPPAKPGAAQP